MFESIHTTETYERTDYDIRIDALDRAVELHNTTEPIMARTSHTLEAAREFYKFLIENPHEP